MSTISEKLADWIVSIDYDSIPSKYVHSAKENIMDMFACGIFGSSRPWVRIVSDTVKEWRGVEEATLWGHREKLPCVNAVLVNANAVNAFEYDDTYVPTGIHPGALVVTSSLATAEKIGSLTGKDLITAVVVGQEVSSRIRSGLGWSVLHGWNGTAICSTFGAAAATGKIMGLDADQIVNAFGICGPYVGGLLTYGFKAMAKRIVNARSAQGGLMAAFLAEKGYTGYRDIFESAQGGFCGSHSSDPTIDKITEGLGDNYLMENLVLKKYPNCTSFHAVADAITDILSENMVDPKSVEFIIVNTTSGAQKNNVGKDYDNISSAQMSMDYAAAALVVDGELGVDQYSEQRIESPEIREMVNKVRIVVDPFLESKGLDHRMAAKVDIHLTDGSMIQSDYVHRPRAMNKEQLERKFYSLTTKVIPKNQATEIMGNVRKLEKCNDLRVLAEQLMLK